MRHLIAGAGEVGSALFEVLTAARGTPHIGEVAIRDLQPITFDTHVLHVCIPWSEAFVDAVHGLRSDHNAALVIVHSTVPPGTCDPQGWVHSPVRGRHPHLAAGLRASVKHCGGARADEAARIFTAAGMATRVHERAADTEAAKIWELIQYGINIRVQKAIHEWCAKHDLDHDIVYRQFAQTYNDAYTRLGQPHLRRPVLEHMDGPIGGHCVTRNATLIEHPLADLVAWEP